MTGPFIRRRAGEGVGRRGREKDEEEGRGKGDRGRRFAKQVEREKETTRETVQALPKHTAARQHGPLAHSLEEGSGGPQITRDISPRTESNSDNDDNGEDTEHRRCVQPCV